MTSGAVTGEAMKEPRVRQVVLGVTGSIAAYKAAELVRLLVKSRVGVEVILTRAGAQFLTPLTLSTLSGRPVTTDLWDATGGDPQAGIWHIQASRESDLIVVAPATGNILGKAAHGIADDALSTAILASTAPVLFAPAMNTKMWEHPAVQDNVRILRSRGAQFVAPGSGELACGEVGAGRMAEPEEIHGEVMRLLAASASKGRVLVTAGGTEEAVDPVRCLSNHSSGRMGFAIAEAARDLGWEVTLVHARSSTPPPFGVEKVRVSSALEMANAVEHLHGAHDVLIMAAAVADYRPRRATTQKIASGESDLRIELTPNPDILAGLQGQRDHQVTVGFALEWGPAGEAGDAERQERARAKLRQKGCDLIVLNNPHAPGSAFGGDTNQVTLIDASGAVDAWPLSTKDEIAHLLMARVETMVTAKRRGARG